MTWVLRRDYRRKDRKTGEMLDDHDYYVREIMGIAHECTGDIAKAKTFRSKTLAEVYARNKGLAGRKPYRAPAA